MDGPYTKSSRERRSVPSIGNDTSSRWWLVVLLPSVVVVLIFSLVVFLDDSANAGEYLGGGGAVLFVVLMVVTPSLCIAGIYIDTEKIRDRDLEWQPRWWVYPGLGVVLAVLLIYWVSDGDDGIGSALVSMNFGMIPIGLWYAVMRVRHAGIA